MSIHIALEVKVLIIIMGENVFLIQVLVYLIHCVYYIGHTGTGLLGCVRLCGCGLGGCGLGRVRLGTEREIGEPF